MEGRNVRFFFDYISSNAYLAWLALPPLLAKYDAKLEPVPVLFAGLLESSGQMGPAESPVKAFWMWKNNLRKAALLGQPLELPPHHPFNPLLALRASSLSDVEHRRIELIDGLFRAVWTRRLHVSDPEVVRRVADEVGLDGKHVVAHAQAPSVKNQLRTQTDGAIAANVFGVPSMLVGDEVFWGYDDLPHLELHLAGKDPLDPDALRDVQVPEPSAARNRSSTEREPK